MSCRGFTETILLPIFTGVAKAPGILPRLFVALRRRLARWYGVAAGPKAGSGGNPDDGEQGAGVPAKLRPPPPVLAAAAVQALPASGEREAA